MQGNIQQYLKRFWQFVWHEDSLASWIVSVLIAFILVKFIIYPGLGLIFDTKYPVVAVVSGSMEHGLAGDNGNYVVCGNVFNEKNDINFDSYWNICGNRYLDLNISKEQFSTFRFKDGFNKGDEVIQKTAAVLLKVSRTRGSAQDFIGHIGGDDFIVITLPERAEPMCKKIIERFDAAAPSFYNEEDRKRGYIVSADRQGVVRQFPFLSIAIGVASNLYRRLTTVGQVSHIGAEMKQFSKRQKGSAYGVDRRKDPDYTPPS